MPNILIEDLKRVTKESGSAPTSFTAYQEAGGKFTEWQFRKRGGFSAVFEQSGCAGDGGQAGVSLKLRKAVAEIDRLKKLHAETEKLASSSERIRDLIHGTDRAYEADTSWLRGARNVKHGNRGLPVLMLSDLHFDEVVNKAQMNGMNEYNRSIATRRIKQVFKGFIDLYKYRLCKPQYDGCILNLGGDIFSGNIHEELAETNEFVINQSILAMEDILIDGISALAEEFGKVYIPCVTGNHGRHHKKPRAKNYAWENYEWLIYMHLQRHFRDDKRVTVEVTDALDILYPVYRRHYLLQHGQEFKGGNGIGGIMIPILRGLAKKQGALQGVNRHFHVALMGHFHQYIHTSQLVVNGTTKGYDEWTKSMGFSFEKPQQAAWLEHPHHGMVLRTPIFCDI